MLCDERDIEDEYHIGLHINEMSSFSRPKNHVLCLIKSTTFPLPPQTFALPTFPPLSKKLHINLSLNVIFVTLTNYILKNYFNKNYF